MALVWGWPPRRTVRNTGPRSMPASLSHPRRRSTGRMRAPSGTAMRWPRPSRSVFDCRMCSSMPGLPSGACWNSTSSRRRAQISDLLRAAAKPTANRAASRVAMTRCLSFAASRSQCERMSAISYSRSAFVCCWRAPPRRVRPRRTCVTRAWLAGDSRFRSRYFQLIAATAMRIVARASGSPCPVVAFGDLGSVPRATRNSATSSGLASRGSLRRSMQWAANRFQPMR